MIAHGDTCLERYNDVAHGTKICDESVDIESIERNKYLIYAHFQEAYADKSKNLAQSEVIEIEWDQIKELEADAMESSQAVNIKGPSSSVEDLGVSQAWEIVDTTEAASSQATNNPTQAVDMQILKQSAETRTILFDTELRQLLIDDLEELECFLK